MNIRPSLHETYLKMLSPLEQRTTCIRRGVACILTDSKGRVLSTGYNGVAAGEPHCNRQDPVDKEHHNKCSEFNFGQGQGLEICKAIHAEQNALLQCPSVDDISVAYVSCTPCIHCVKLLMNTSCQLIVAKEVYDSEALLLWTKSGKRDYIIYDNI